MADPLTQLAKRIRDLTSQLQDTPVMVSYSGNPDGALTGREGTFAWDLTGHALYLNVSDTEGTDWCIVTCSIAWKSHRVADMTLAAINTWEDVTWDTEVPAESTPGINYYDAGGPGEDKSILVIQPTDRIFYVSGCTRPEWTGFLGAALIATRVVESTNAGVTWTEARCLQALRTRSFLAGEVGTLPYHGTVAVTSSAETWLKLQVRVDDLDMILSGWPTFDNPTAATIAIHAT